MENNNHPLVAVVLATHNQAAKLGRAMESVLSQSYQNLQLMVVDGGSTDNTKSIVEMFLKDPRVKYLYQEKRGSNVFLMNYGISVSTAKYIAILDDDDFWANPDKITKQVEFLEAHPDHVLVGGGAIKTDETGKETVRYLMPETDEAIRQNLLTSSMFVHISVMYKKDAWQKTGGYDKEFGGAADWDLWLKMGTVGKLHNIPEIFVSYTPHPTDNPSYVERSHSKWDWLQINLALKKKFKNQYPHYTKAVVVAWLGYGYSLLPFRRRLWTTMFKLRSLMFGDFTYGNKS